MVNVVTSKAAVLGFLFNLMLFTLAGVYLVAHRMCCRKMVPIPITLITFTIGYSLVAAITRFRLPLYPLLEILAAGGVLSGVAALQLLFLYEGKSRLQSRS